jgi:hypothetical protein
VKIKGIKIRILGIKITVGADKVRDALLEIAAQAEWARFKAFLEAEGMPSEMAHQAADGARAWIMSEIGDG